MRQCVNFVWQVVILRIIEHRILIDLLSKQFRSAWQRPTLAKLVLPPRVPILTEVLQTQLVLIANAAAMTVPRQQVGTAWQRPTLAKLVQRTISLN